MGGSGSGRYADTYNYTVEDCLDLDISMMIRRKWLELGCNSTGALRWTRNEEKTGSIGYKARLGAGLLLVFLAMATYYFHNFFCILGIFVRFLWHRWNLLTDYKLLQGNNSVDNNFSLPEQPYLNN